MVIEYLKRQSVIDMIKANMEDIYNDKGTAEQIISDIQTMPEDKAEITFRVEEKDERN